MLAKETEENTREATCPSCAAHVVFTHAGDQPVPPRVAVKLGLDAEFIALWHCSACLSTISEIDLR